MNASTKKLLMRWVRTFMLMGIAAAIFMVFALFGNYIFPVLAVILVVAAFYALAGE